MKEHRNSLSLQNNVTVVFGYSLFVLTVLSFILSTVIPFGSALFTPAARHFNILMFIIAFAVAAILPALAAYILGDQVTHAKNKLLHHYNGVLFGIAAYWIARLFTMILFNKLSFVHEQPFPIPLMVINIVPVVLAIIVMAFIAGTYSNRQNYNSSVLSYCPYQVVVITALTGLLIFLATYQSYEPGFTAQFSFVTLISPIILIAVSYKALARYHKLKIDRLTDAVIAASIGWITIWVSAPFIAIFQWPYELTSVLSYVTSLAVFIAYLYLRLRKV